MCSWIVHRVDLNGSAKDADGWFAMSEARVDYDHPYNAPFDHALTVDLPREATSPDQFVRLELDADSARRLIAAMEAALDRGAQAHQQAELRETS